MKASGLFYVMVILTFLTLLACSQDDCLGSDVEIDDDYVIANDSLGNFQETEEGLYYIIDDLGGATRPTQGSLVTVNFTGTTTEGETFDETSGDPVEFVLDDLITGWQIGLPLIGEGGRIRLFVPSNLAYGANQAGNLCINTDLIFTIELVSVN